MNYKKIYDALVEKAKVRGLDKSQHEGYYEIHHIVPRCMGGTDESSNLVMFTAREHYLAHVILAKLHPEVHGLTYAAFMMVGEYKGNSRIYEKLKLRVRKLLNEANYGTIQVDYTGKQIGRLLVLKYIVDHDKSKKNPHRWECLCTCGKTTFVATQYLKDGRISSCGCLLSEVSRNKMLGRPKPAETREKIAETLRERGKHPWLNTRLKVTDLDKWENAQSLHDLWLQWGKPKSQNMMKSYNSEFNTTFKRSTFKTLVGKFADGWVPSDDQDWLLWVKNIKGDLNG
jgi:hypothetical protein